MKKTILLLPLIVAMGLLSGCNSDEVTPTDPPPVVTPDPEPEPDPDPELPYDPASSYDYGKSAQWNFELDSVTPDLIKDEEEKTDLELSAGIKFSSESANDESKFSLEFDGAAHSGLSASSEVNFNPGTDSLSVSFWFKTEVDTAASGASTLMVLNKGNGSSSYAGYSAFIEKGIICWRTADDSNHKAGVSLPVEVGNWQQFTGVIDRETNTISASINGQSAGETFGCGGANNTTNDLSGFAGINTTTDLMIGERSDSSGVPYTGLLDELIILNRAITPIESKVAAGVAPTPVGHWPLTEKDTVKDVSGNAYDGELVGTPGFRTEGEVGYLRLDQGVNQYVDLASSVDNFKDMEKGTISAWMRTDNTAGGAYALLSLSNGAHASSEMRFFTENAVPQFNIRNDGTDEVNVSMQKVVNDNKWYHLAVSVDGSGTRAFINGLPINQVNSTAFFSTVPSPDNMAIGRNIDSSNQNGQWFYKGDIANVRIEPFAVRSVGDFGYLYAADFARMGVEMESPVPGPFEDDMVKVDSLPVFDNGGSFCYRIPAMVEMNDGSGAPVLMAFAERRYNGCGDHGTIDIVMKSSIDSGITWSDEQVMADTDLATTIPEGHSQGSYTITGNQAPFVYSDPKDDTTKLGMIFNTSSWSEGQVNDKDEARRYVWFKSFVFDADNQLVESDPAQDITTSVTEDDWKYWIAMTPGHAIQMSNGVIAIAGNHYEKNDPVYDNKYFPHMTYFDPSKAEDKFSYEEMDRDDLVGGNESSAAEFKNKLVVTIRDHNQMGAVKKRRYAAIKDLEGADWKEAIWFGYNDTAIIDPVVEGSILNFKDSVKERLILTNPNSTSGRTKLSTHFAYDFVADGADAGKVDWSETVQTIDGGNSAYSDLAKVTPVDASHVDNDPYIGSLYERGNGGGIFFTKYNIEWVTNGYDTFIKQGE